MLLVLVSLHTLHYTPLPASHRNQTQLRHGTYYINLKKYYSQTQTIITLKIITFKINPTLLQKLNNSRDRDRLKEKEKIFISPKL